jgi:hypothetical protein
MRQCPTVALSIYFLHYLGIATFVFMVWWFSLLKLFHKIVVFNWLGAIDRSRTVASLIGPKFLILTIISCYNIIECLLLKCCICVSIICKWFLLTLQGGAGSSKKNRTTSGIYVIITLLTDFLFGGDYVIMSHYSCLGIANWMFTRTHLSHFSHAANASALKLTCELLRLFVTGSSILKEKHINVCSRLWFAHILCHLVFDMTFLLMQRLFSVLQQLQRLRVMVK